MLSRRMSVRCMSFSSKKDDILKSTGDDDEVSGDQVLVGINCKDCVPPMCS